MFAKIFNPIAIAIFLFFFSVTSSISKGLLVGYIDYTSSGQPELKEAIEHGYSTVIIAFASVTSSGVPDLHLILPTYNLNEQIKLAHAQNTKVLISFGGQNNTFNPSDSVSPIKLAKNVYNNILRPYGFDGVDFDLESSPWGASKIKSLIISLKQINPNVIISGAPQASIWVKPESGSIVTFAPAIWSGDHGLVQSGLFDYIFLQAYNQYGGMQVYQDGKRYTDTTPGIYSATYDLYRKNVFWGKTHLIVGEPSSNIAGHGLTAVQTARDISCIKTGIACQYQMSQLYPEFRGVMTWSIGHDEDNSWLFSKTVTEVL